MQYIKSSEIPANPVFKGKTYVAIVMFSIDSEWYSMGRDKRIEITREHMDEFRNLSDKVARTHLSARSFSKYDAVEILESDSLEHIDDMIRVFKAGRKAKQMRIVDVITTMKTEGDLVEH